MKVKIAYGKCSITREIRKGTTVSNLINDSYILYALDAPPMSRLRYLVEYKDHTRILFHNYKIQEPVTIQLEQVSL